MIRLPRAIAAEIGGFAEQAYPEECCGLLVGRDLESDAIAVTRAVASANVAESDRRHSFEVDPQVRFHLMRALEGTNQRIVGHYHSHPDHAPVPSAHDLARAFEPDLAWLIVGVAAGHAGPCAAFRLAPDGSAFRPESLEIGG